MSPCLFSARTLGRHWTQYSCYFWTIVSKSRRLKKILNPHDLSTNKITKKKKQMVGTMYNVSHFEHLGSHTMSHTYGAASPTFSKRWDEHTTAVTIWDPKWTHLNLHNIIENKMYTSRAFSTPEHLISETIYNYELSKTTCVGFKIRMIARISQDENATRWQDENSTTGVTQ